jgi:hypothetical protein
MTTRRDFFRKLAAAAAGLGLPALPAVPPAAFLRAATVDLSDAEAARRLWREIADLMARQSDPDAELESTIVIEI